MLAEPVAQDYQKNEAGFWTPRLYPQQMLVFNCYKRFVLVEGCKLSGKTLACCHKIARHMYETDRAEVAIFSKVVKQAKNAGSYQLLTEVVVPQWVSAGVTKWVKSPTVDGSTKVNIFSIENCHGTTSKCSLHSIEFDSDIEARVKNTAFTMVYFIELSLFESRLVFDSVITQLRSFHLPYEAHQLLCDTNPAETGTDSWIYKLWWEEKHAESTNPDDKIFRDELEVIHFELKHNEGLDPRTIATLKSAYAHSQDLTDRYVHGLWTASSTNSHFSDVFRDQFHVVGHCFGSNREDWEVLVPPETCFELFVGMDLGTVNHAGVIISKRISGDGDVVFDVIDELVILKERVSIEEYTQAFVEKMIRWEDFLRDEYKHKRPPLWRCWSDADAWNFQASAATQNVAIVRNASEGKIILHASYKKQGSVRLRVDLLRRLLFENKIFFSAQLEYTLAMLKGLKKGKTEGQYVDTTSKVKHVFDACSYCLCMESPLDTFMQGKPEVKANHSSIITVGF